MLTLPQFFSVGVDGNLWRQTVGWDGTLSAWENLGNPGKGLWQICSTTNMDGRFEVFATAFDGSLYHRWEESPNGGWSQWGGLPGQWKEIDVISNRDGRLEVFGRGLGNALHHVWQLKPNGGGWSDFVHMGGGTVGRFAVAANQDGRLEVFAIDKHQTLVHSWQDKANWSAWDRLGGSCNRIAVAANDDGRLEVFAIANDSGIRHLWQIFPNGGWSPWRDLEGSAREIVAWTQPDGLIHVLVRGTDGSLRSNIQMPRLLTRWTGWQVQDRPGVGHDHASLRAGMARSITLDFLTRFPSGLRDDRNRLDGADSDFGKQRGELIDKIEDAAFDVGLSCAAAAERWAAAAREAAKFDPSKIKGWKSLAKAAPEGWRVLVAMLASGECALDVYNLLDYQNQLKSLDSSVKSASDLRDRINDKSLVTDVDPMGVDQRGYVET